MLSGLLSLALVACTTAQQDRDIPPVCRKVAERIFNAVFGRGFGGAQAPGAKPGVTMREDLVGDLARDLARSPKQCEKTARFSDAEWRRMIQMGFLQ